MPEYAVSVDLPWGASGEAAVVIVERDGRANWQYCGYPDELISCLVHESEAWVLLDIPVYGLDNLRGHHFRPIDRALQHLGIWLRPSTSAEGRGLPLVRRIVTESGLKPERVLEMYPYAAYKVIDYIRRRGRIPCLRGQAAQPILDMDFPQSYPMPYKRRSVQGSRTEGMQVLFNLLTNPELGLRFETALPSPDTKGYNLKRLTDVYDATLGAVLGWHMLRDSPWAVIKGDREHGQIALLADEWLSAQLDQRLDHERVS